MHASEYPKLWWALLLIPLVWCLPVVGDVLFDCCPFSESLWYRCVGVGMIVAAVLAKSMARHHPARS